MSFLNSLWDLVLVFVYAFIVIAALVALFTIITDLFRDSELAGWKKAVWLVLLVFIPVLTALVYLIARGNGMSRRSVAAVQESRTATDDYIRSVTTTSPAEQIATAKGLLDSGTITDEEFATLKARALQSA